MTRFLSLLTGGLLALATVWACSPKPATGDDDDTTAGTGNKGQGGMTSIGGKAGSGSVAGSGATCAAPAVTCGGVCTSVLSDPAHCGNCTTSCNGQLCSNGVCKATCDSGTTLCALTGTCLPPAGCVAGGVGGAGGVSGSAGSGIGGQAVASGGMGAVAGTSTASGGMGAVAGSGTSGSAGTGSSTNPAGYWTYKDWHGCAWTGIDTVASTTTTVQTGNSSTTDTTGGHKDFTTGHADGDPFCVSGSVNADYDSVALLGFNLAEPADGASCAYNPASATAMGPPGVALTGTGIAINFSKTSAFTLRIQIQGPNGATDENDRWCYTITDASGPVFAPYSSFNTKCWDGTGTAYSNQPVSAVVFLVPGATAATPYNFCINGFAAGTSAADAPTGGTSGPLTGTIGGSGATDLDFQRVKVKAGGHSYIIQNNNWGNPSGSNQTLSYSDNSFKVTAMDGSGSSAPASFPSIYIGANGDTQGGTYDTTSDDHLPKQISAITSVQTTFKYTLGSGQMNAAFDIWFASSPPSACYGDGISGFVMLWFHKPSNFNPIGANPTASGVSIGGHTWNVYVGQRGSTGSSQGSCTVSNSSAPVVSYVASPEITDWSGDLKPFFTEAAGRGISASWYLTDVFGGFEIWSGGTNAAVSEFTAVVAP